MADWFRRAMVPEVQGQVPNTTPVGGNPFNPPTPADFSKLCKDFASIGGGMFSGMEDFQETQARLEDIERRFRPLALEDQQRIQPTY